MKRFEPPISNSVSLIFKVDEGQTIQDAIIGSISDQGITMCDTETMDDLAMARDNGGRVLYGTTSLEKKIEQLISSYFMSAYEYPSEKRSMFENEFIQSSSLSLSFKNGIAQKIFNESKALKGKDKASFQKRMKDVIKWRNAFAHGTVSHDTLAQGGKRVMLSYYSGGNQKQKLNDDFWDDLMFIYAEANRLIDKAIDSLRN